jgi:hypothetical protein
LILSGDLKLCVSYAVFLEYTEVLQREKFKKYPGFETAAIAFLEEIKNHCFWYEPKLKIDFTR